MPDGDFITESQSERLNNNTNHNADVRLEYKLNTTTKIFVNPQITANTNDFTSSGISKSMNANGVLFNESNENTFSSADSFTFKNTIQFNKKLNNNGKNFSLQFNNSNSKTTGTGNTNSATLFYQGSQQADIRNQEEQSQSTADNYSATAEYTQPLAINTFLDLGYTIDYDKQTDLLNTYDFNESVNGFIDFNDRLSNHTQTNIVTNTPYIGINYEADKLNWSVNSGLNIADFSASAMYMNNEYMVDKNIYRLISVQASVII